MRRNGKNMEKLPEEVEKMTEFDLQSGLRRGGLSIKKGSRREVINIKRPFYRDVLKAKWFDKRYTIERKGVMRVKAQVKKGGKQIGRIEEKVSLQTKFLVYQNEEKVFEIEGKGKVFKQGLQIKKDSKIIGSMQPTSFYIPLLSTLKEGVKGSYKELSEKEEELLLMAIIAIVV